MTGILACGRRGLFVLGVVATCSTTLTACSGTSDPVATQSITELKGPTAAVSVGLGFFTKTIVSIKRSSTFDGEVKLSAEGMPTGMLVSFAPATLSSTAELSEMTISALSTVTPGAHTFIVRASGEGVQSRTLTVQVTVTVPAINVAVASTSASVMQGSTQAIPITISREGGFTGIVGLAALGLPTGVTGTFSPAAIASDATTSTLTLSAPLTVQPSVATFTLRASAQGLADRTIPMQLSVAPTTTPAVLVSVNPTFLQVDGGQFVETTLTLQRFAGFDGAVNVTVDGLPANLTAVPTQFAAGSNTTTLRLNAGEQVGQAAHQLSIRANGTGIQQASTGLAVQTRFMPQFNLIFEDPAAPPQERFKSTMPVTIARGSAAPPLTLNVTRLTQYSLPVTLTMVGAPPGVTSSLPMTTPSSPTTQLLPLFLTVAANAEPGVYNIIVRGQTSTPMTREVTIVLTVN